MPHSCLEADEEPTIVAGAASSSGVTDPGAAAPGEKDLLAGAVAVQSHLQRAAGAAAP